VSIALAHDGDVVLQVSDDGVGLDASTEPTGLGLAGMRERISALGGSLTVRNRDAGQGVCVSARLPREATANVPVTEAES
jgi:signal transduction histidine kinase